MKSDLGGAGLIGLHRTDSFGRLITRYAPMRAQATVLVFPARKRQQRPQKNARSADVIDLQSRHRHVGECKREVPQCISQ